MEGRISVLLAVPNAPAYGRKNVLDDVAVERRSEVRDSWVVPGPAVAWVDVWIQSCPVSMDDDLFAGGRRAGGTKSGGILGRRHVIVTFAVKDVSGSRSMSTIVSSPWLAQEGTPVVYPVDRSHYCQSVTSNCRS